jgi:hypothetical protein
MLEKIKTLVSIANTDGDGLWINDCYKSQGLYETDTSALQDRYQVLVDEGLVEIFEDYLVLTDKGDEVINFMQLPYQHMIKGVQEYQAHYVQVRNEYLEENAPTHSLDIVNQRLVGVEHVLGPVAHNSKWNYSPIN